jgi:YegS/Rv2252/BmrU family lipid kinase
MKITVIFNAHSFRSRRALKYKNTILKLLRQKHNDVEWMETSGPGDGIFLSRGAVDSGSELIVACGGDGTLNEVANGVVGSNVLIGILPAGTSNVFATEAGVPLNLKKAARLIIEGKPTPVDLGLAGTRYFILMLGAGFDAYTIQGVNPKLKRVLGKTAHVYSGFKSFSTFDAQPIKVELLDGPGTFEGYEVIVANTSMYGGKFRLVKAARWNDGVLNVCVFEKGNFLAILRYYLGVQVGRHENFEDFVSVPTTHLRLTGERVLYHIDSEPIGHLPLEVKVAPGAVNIILPVGAEKSNE